MSGLERHPRILTSWLVAVIIAATASGCSRAPAFPDESAFRDAMAAEGWVVIGSFGAHWPAAIADTADSYGEITFTLSGGRRETYRGFEGYDLRVVHLRGEDGTPFTRVLRSRDMTGVVEDGLR